MFTTVHYRGHGFCVTDATPEKLIRFLKNHRSSLEYTEEEFTTLITAIEEGTTEELDFTNLSDAVGIVIGEETDIDVVTPGEDIDGNEYVLYMGCREEHIAEMRRYADELGVRYEDDADTPIFCDRDYGVGNW